jgi:exonuclease SbcC
MGPDFLYALAALASGLAATLAWGAKLRWSKEYKEATEQVIKAKEAEITALKTEVQVLQAVSSGKILEHATTTKQGLEEIIKANEEELKGARAAIEGLKIEIAGRQPGPGLLVPGTGSDPDAANTNPALGASTERSAGLEAELREALRDEKRLRAKDLAFRVVALETAPEMQRRYAAELEMIRSRQAALERSLEEATTVWLRDRQDAETKLQTYRDRAVELKEQIRQVEELGPEGTCPTCGRPVGADYERLLDELQDQWVTIVQDGKWWSSRYEQLDVKPDEVSLLEAELRELRRQYDDRSQQHTRAETMVQEYNRLHEDLTRLRAELGSTDT